MKMEFMGGKKTPQLPALGEGQKQETDPGAFLAHRIQAGLSRAASALGTGQAAAQRVHSDIIPPGTWNASPLPECHHSSGGQSCVLQRKLLTPALSQHHLWCAGAEKTLDYFLWSKVLFQQLTESSRQVLQYSSLYFLLSHTKFLLILMHIQCHPFSTTGNQAGDTNIESSAPTCWICSLFSWY